MAYVDEMTKKDIESMKQKLIDKMPYIRQELLYDTIDNEGAFFRHAKEVVYKNTGIHPDFLSIELDEQQVLHVAIKEPTKDNLAYGARHTMTKFNEFCKAKDIDHNEEILRQMRDECNELCSKYSFNLNQRECIDDIAAMIRSAISTMYGIEEERVEVYLIKADTATYQVKITMPIAIYNINLDFGVKEVNM